MKVGLLECDHVTGKFATSEDYRDMFPPFYRTWSSNFDDVCNGAFRNRRRNAMPMYARVLNIPFMTTLTGYTG